MARYSNASAIGGGRFYIKTMSGIEVPADGLPYTAFAKVIPPYVAVNRAWVHLWMTGKTSAGLHDKQQMLISGQFSNINLDVNTTPLDDDGEGTGGTAGQDKLNGFVDYHQPIASGDKNLYDMDNDQEEPGIGITSWDADESEATQIAMTARQREFLGRNSPYKCNFGLGANAFLDGAASLRYAKEYTKNNFGVGNPNLDIKSFRLISIRGWTDTLQGIEADDWHFHVFGNTTPDPDSLMRDASRFFGQQGMGMKEVEGDTTSDDDFTPSDLRTGIGLQDSTNNEVFPWLQSGWGTSGSTSGSTLGGSGFDSDVVMMLQAKVTLECAVVKPTPMNIYTPDG